MTTSQYEAIVRAAQAWAQAHERVMAAAAELHQAQHRVRLYPGDMLAPLRLTSASASLSTAKRREREALEAVRCAYLPRRMTIKEKAREVIDAMFADQAT